MVKIFIGSDHGGFYLKEFIKSCLLTSYNIEDFGCESSDSCDYPEIAHNLCKKLEEELKKSTITENIGILICGTGQGMKMVANKYPNIRCALCYNNYITEQARKHNNANVMAIGARTKDEGDWDEFIEMINLFIKTKFGKGRHERRVNSINIIN